MFAEPTRVVAILARVFDALGIRYVVGGFFRFASPEDTLLHKLVWYKLGNEISERQWRDVHGLLEVQGDALDQQYLDRLAPALDVVNLLARARREHGRA